MKLRFTPRATANLIVADYIQAHNPAAAQRVRAAIYDSLQNLILFPHVGRQQKAEGVHSSARLRNQMTLEPQAAPVRCSRRIG